MKLLGLDIADVITLSAYLIGITALGMWMSKTVHNTTDYFVGGRRFGKWLATFFALGAGTHSDQAVSVAAKTYTSGMSGIWYQWLWLFITPFYWILGPINRRCRCLTLGDFFEARYHRSVAMLAVVIGILSLMVNIGTMLKGSGAVVGAVSDEISEDAAIAIMTLLFVVYGVAGGLAAAVVTDFVQGLLTIVFSFMLLPFALHHLGGFHGLHEAVAASFVTNPQPGVAQASDLWSLVAPGEITLFYILVITINGLVGIVAQPGGVPGANAAKSEYAAQFGGVAGNLIKRLCTVAWCLLGMCAFAMYPDLLETGREDQSFGLVAREFLPNVAPGLIGVFIASLLAAIMSTCDAFMIICAGLFTQNLYRPLTHNAKPESHYLLVGRIASVVCVAGGVFFAYEFESVIHGLELFWKVSAMMGIAFWVGIIWRKGTTAGAWAGTLAAFAALLLTSDISFGGQQLWSFNDQVAASLPGFMQWQGELYLPWQMIIYLVAGFVAFVAVSLVTTPPPKAQLDNFYAVLRTPVEEGEVIDEPFTLPKDKEPAEHRKLINHPDIEIPVPRTRTVVGFLVICVIGAGLIGMVAILVRVGQLPQ